MTTNAIEATAEESGSIHLNIKTASSTDISELHRFPIEWAPREQKYVCLEIKDSGCGLQKKDMAKLFDPFFSTKFTGRGLGLAVVLGIVKVHGACITAEKRIEGGSIFRVYFPLLEQINPCQPEPVVKVSKNVQGVTVLLVEDDDAVRKMSERMLVCIGFKVLQARDGIEAVEILRQHMDEISCTLCDLSMPRMGGWETIAVLRGIRCDLPVVLASGYDEASVMSGEHPEFPEYFLHKPYDIGKLKNAINQAIVDRHGMPRK